MEQLNPNTFIPIGTIGFIGTAKIVITPYDSCKNCYLYFKKGLCDNANCASSGRRDKTPIMFKLL